MESKKVISRKNLPAKSPILGTVVYVTALDYWNAPQWLWGAVGFLFIFIWIIWIISLFNQDEVDIISMLHNTMKPSKTETRSKFKDRVEEEFKTNK